MWNLSAQFVKSSKSVVYGSLLAQNCHAKNCHLGGVCRADKFGGGSGPGWPVRTAPGQDERMLMRGHIKRRHPLLQEDDAFLQ